MGNADSKPKQLPASTSAVVVSSNKGGGVDAAEAHKQDTLTERSSSDDENQNKQGGGTTPTKAKNSNSSNNNKPESGSKMNGNGNTNNAKPGSGTKNGTSSTKIRSSSKSNGKNGSVSTPRRKNRSSQQQQQGRDDASTSVELLPSSSSQGIVPNYIRDEQVHVNLAMSDLMAYLQVVANNSSQLPATRRDDPDCLDRIVTTLSPEDYARKSAAFIPADVRVIGATFTRYGRVWDLPTTEEYNACDGAQEPGRSYGGACSNAMLKVLYDAANDQNELADADKAADALFDDDEDEEDDDGDNSSWGRSFKSGFSIDKDFQNQCTISWCELLRKMKAEMKDIEYAQIPKITSSRKIDLHKRFSLVPDDFDPDKGNKKRSLLIGCNYRNIPGAELKASHDDVRSMKDYIVNVHGFPESDEQMTILLDEDGYKHPTFMNIVEAFKALSEESQPGDAVFVQFSGHGGRVLDAPISDSKKGKNSNSDAATTYDEVIVPSDYKVSGLLRDTLIFKTLLAPMRYGVMVTIMIDCCDTGMVLELPYSWSSRGDTSLAKPTMNDDFSFMRFLKVVKTLYETSTFTQLGKTVGSALNTTGVVGGTPTKDSSHEDAELTVASEKYKTTESIMMASHESILDVITEACTPATRATKCVDDQRIKDATTCGTSRREEAPLRQSLLDQIMMGCSLLAPPEEEYFSDEDTEYRESFESLTEDEDDFKRKSGRGRRRTRR